MTMEREIRVIWPQIKDSHKKLEEARNDCFLESPQEAHP